MKACLNLALIFATIVVANQAAYAGLVISVTSTTNTSTANTSTGTQTDKREFNSLLSTITGSQTAPNIVGGTASIATRMATMTQADKDSNTNTLVSNNTQNATVTYSVTFGITVPNPLMVYDLTFNTSRVGELTILNESTGHGGNATLTLGAITATKTGGPGSIGTALNLASQSHTSPNNNNGNWIHIPVNQNGNTTISGITGNQTITMSFTWAQNANSANAGGFLSNGQGDDGTIRLGRAQTTNAASGAYPGVNGRNINNDGHFFTATATIRFVPEPSSALLALFSLVGLANFRRRAC